MPLEISVLCVGTCRLRIQILFFNCLIKEGIKLCALTVLVPVILIAGFGTALHCVLKRQHHLMMWELSWRIKSAENNGWLSTVRKIWFYVLPSRLLGGGFNSHASDDFRNKKQKFSLLPDHRLLSARLADDCHMLLYVLKAYHVLFFSCLSPPPSYIIFSPVNLAE